MNNSSFSYRKELDGLRALAVMPVVFYHAGISLFSGAPHGVEPRTYLLQINKLNKFTFINYCYY